MKTSMDFRSLLIGILLALCILFLLGSARATIPNSNARFQLALPGEGSNALVIDTTTGQVWERHPFGGDQGAKFRESKLDDALVHKNK